MKNHVLFLCTGNYYRSRFAEIFFNHLADQFDLDWEADSRGIATEFGMGNSGPISDHALQGLRARGVEIPVENRYPLQLHEQDLAQAEHVIALYEPEHRMLLHKRFPGWAEKVEYWEIPDLNRSSANIALSLLEEKIVDFVKQLSMRTAEG